MDIEEVQNTAQSKDNGDLLDEKEIDSLTFMVFKNEDYDSGVIVSVNDNESFYEISGDESIILEIEEQINKLRKSCMNYEKMIAYIAQFYGAKSVDELKRKLYERKLQEHEMAAEEYRKKLQKK